MALICGLCELRGWVVTPAQAVARQTPDVRGRIKSWSRRASRQASAKSPASSAPVGDCAVGVAVLLRARRRDLTDPHQLQGAALSTSCASRAVGRLQG